MLINIRRIRTIPLKVILARSLTFLSGWTTSPSGVSFQKSSSVIFVSAILEQDRTTVLTLHADYFHGLNCMSLLLNRVLLLSAETILLISFQR